LADNKTGVSRILVDADNIPLVAVLALMGTIAGSVDLLHYALPEPALPYCVAAAGILVVQALRVKRNILRQRSLPASGSAFDPFARTLKENKDHGVQLGHPVFWPRPEITAALVSIVQRAASAHVIVTGRSGVGKSWLVTVEASNRLRAAGFGVSTPLTQYERVLPDLLSQEMFRAREDTQRISILDDYEQLLSANTCSVREILELPLANPFEFSGGISRSTYLIEADEIWKRVVTFLDSRLDSENRHVFVFDQVERLLHLFTEDSERGTQQVSGLSLYFFVRLTTYLRESLHARTVFVTRSEYLYQSLDFLEHQIGSASQSADSSMTVHFLCPGINEVTDFDATREIRNELRRSVHLSQLLDEFAQLCELDSRVFSNTFLTKMNGFMAENCLGDPRVAELLNTPGHSKLEALRIYFEYLFNDYAKYRLSLSDIASLKIVLTAIACENQVAGRAVNLNKIASLSHLPHDEVERACSYLQDIGLLTPEYVENLIHLRVAHDVIGDHAREDEQFADNPALRDAIEGLSQARAPIGMLTSVERFPSPLFDWLDQARSANVGLWALCSSMHSAPPPWSCRPCALLSQPSSPGHRGPLLVRK